jgi:DNA-binding PadR family transcriptional regulator
MSTATRLLALGMLAGAGPMHGHQIRRRAEIVNVGEWGDVRIGALYGALHRMEEDGLIKAVRREQAGNFPERTVYEITREGTLELFAIRDRALEYPGLGGDAVDVAMMVTSGVPEEDLKALLGRRQRAVERSLIDLRVERDRLIKNGYGNAAALAVFAHWEERFEAEIRWHARLEPLIDDLAKGSIATTMPVSDASPSAHDPGARKVNGKPRRHEKKPTKTRERVRKGAA